MIDNTVSNLLNKGNDHFEAASILLKSEKKVTNLICFHLEQCIEKYLKSFLYANKILVKKNESLLSMLNLCINYDPDFKKIDQKILITLNSYGIERLYSSYNKDAALEEVTIFLKFSEHLMEFIKNKSIPV